MDNKSGSLRGVRGSSGGLRHRGALLFVSVLLHSLLVLMPWHKKSRPLAEPLPPALPISVVDASQLPQLSLAEAQQLPVAPAEPSISPPAPAVEVLPPVDLATPIPLDEPVIEPSEPLANEATLEEPPSSESPTTPSTPSVGGTPTTPIVTPPSEAKIAADWESFVSHLQLQNDSRIEDSTLLQIFNIYGYADSEQTDQFFYEEKDEDGNRRPKLNVLYKHLFSDQTPEQILETVVMPGFSGDTSLQLQPQEDFTAGLARRLIQGDVLRYLIIVQFNGTNDSVLILSDSLPEG